jgi:hypothetical protein
LVFLCGPEREDDCINNIPPLNRRRFIRLSAALDLLAGLQSKLPAYMFPNTGLKASPVGDSETSGQQEVH